MSTETPESTPAPTGIVHSEYRDTGRTEYITHRHAHGLVSLTVIQNRGAEDDETAYTAITLHLRPGDARALGCQLLRADPVLGDLTDDPDETGDSTDPNHERR